MAIELAFPKLDRNIPERRVRTIEGRLGRFRFLGREEALTRWQDLSYSVRRWGGRVVEVEGKDPYGETLVNHVRNMNLMVDQLAASSALRQGLNLRKLNIILGVHDLGEVKTGDITRAQKDYEAKIAAAEKAGADYFLSTLVHELPYETKFGGSIGRVLDRVSGGLFTPLKRTMRDGYRAFDGLGEIEILRQSHNKEALMAKVLDRMDAVDRGVEYFHQGKIGEEKDDAVLRQLAGANRASSLALYKLFELLLERGKRRAAEDLGRFMLDYKDRWDIFDGRIFDTPRPISGDNLGMSYEEFLPSFAETMREIEERYKVTFRDSKGISLKKRSVDEPAVDQSIQSFMYKTITEDLLQHI